MKISVLLFILLAAEVRIGVSNPRIISEPTKKANAVKVNHRKGKTVFIYHEQSNCFGILFLIQIWRCGTTTTTTPPPPPPDANAKKLERIITAKLPALLEIATETLNQPELKNVVSKLAPKIAYPIAHFASEQLIKGIPDFVIDKLDDVQVPFEIFKPSSDATSMTSGGTGNESLKRFLEQIIPIVLESMASAIFPGLGFIIAPATTALMTLAPDAIPSLAGFIAMQINDVVPYDVIKILEELRY